MAKTVGDLHFNSHLSNKQLFAIYKTLPIIFYILNLDRTIIFATGGASTFLTSEMNPKVGLEFLDSLNEALQSHAVVHRDFRTRSGIIMQQRIWPLYKSANSKKPVGIAHALMDFGPTDIKVNFDPSAPWNQSLKMQKTVAAPQVNQRLKIKKPESDAQLIELIDIAYEDISKNWNIQMDFVSIQPPLFGHVQCFTDKFLHNTQAVDPDDLLGKCPYEAAENGLLSHKQLHPIKDLDIQFLKLKILTENPEISNSQVDITDKHLRAYREQCKPYMPGFYKASNHGKRAGFVQLNLD